MLIPPQIFIKLSKIAIDFFFGVNFNFEKAKARQKIKNTLNL
jgi:hypothetical protein